MSPQKAAPETQLIARAQRGDEFAFSELYETHKRRVYSLCLRMTGNTAEAEDLSQEAFLQLFRKISTFRGESAFSTWLHRLVVNVVLMHLRKTQSNHGVDWDQLCVTHAARPQFVFELQDETVRLRLLAVSQRDNSAWVWNGHEWQLQELRKRPTDKPEILDDPRLEPATLWLRQLDWFTPEPGLWVGDATEAFLGMLARAWLDHPMEAEYLGNPAFHRLFLTPRQLRPQLVLHGSGIDWFTVSAAWEREGLKLTRADLERRA